MTAESFRGLMARMLARLDAEAGYIEARFPYFIEKRAPVSNVASLLDYDVVLRGEVTAERGLDFSIKVVVPVTSLCPCSKKISDYGAHNQRSHVTITATVGTDVTIEELVAIAEQEASCEVYGLLKRPDEKYVTERAYDNPKFVEDMVRDVARHLIDDPRVLAFTVESENFESIHNHSAYALIERDKRSA
jgi:GTP cyclohydrolase I